MEDGILFCLWKGRAIAEFACPCRGWMRKRRLGSGDMDLSARDTRGMRVNCGVVYLSSLGLMISSSVSRSLTSCLAEIVLLGFF